MSLNASSCAASLWELLQDVANLKPDGTNKDPLEEPTRDYPTDFASIFNDYVKGGVVAGAENSGGSASTLSSLLSSYSSGESVNINDFALSFADFMSKVAVDPGTPAHGGVSVAKVTNDSMGKVGLFIDAINSSLTTEEKKPYYLHFIKNLEDKAIKKIIWTITEVMSDGSRQDFEETMS